MTSSTVPFAVQKVETQYRQQDPCVQTDFKTNFELRMSSVPKCSQSTHKKDASDAK
jgi:hypothetical protein